MTYDLDIYRSAKLLIDQHGEDASGFAVKQADKRAEAGDLDGRATRLRVVRAIKELRAADAGTGRLCSSPRCFHGRQCRCQQAPHVFALIPVYGL